MSLFLRLAWGTNVFCVSCAVLHVFVREATRSEQALTKRLMHDKLTGLPNRYYVANYLERLSKGAGLAGHWVAITDIDDFKKVNDTYGHNCGDLCSRIQASEAFCCALSAAMPEVICSSQLLRA